MQQAGMQQWTSVQDDVCQSSLDQQRNGSRPRRLQCQDNLSSLPSLPTSKKRSHNVVNRVSELDTACSALANLLATRVRDYQALAGLPLKGRRRTPAELSSLLDQAEKACGDGATWQALGMTASPFSPTLMLPDWCRKDVWGPMDILLALAGHLSQSDSACMSLSLSTPIMLSNQASQQRAGMTSGLQLNSQSKAVPSPSTCPSLINNQWSHGGATTGQGNIWNGYLPNSMSNLTWLPCIKDVPHANADYLREFMSDLRPHNRHVGVDDRSTPWFREMKAQAAATLLEHPDSSLCRGFARFGVPHAYRPGIWQAALGLLTGPISEVDKSHFESLVHEACCQPLLCDAWVLADCEAVCDSEQFFLFGELVRSVLLAFYRDDKIRNACGNVALPPAFAISSDRDSMSTSGTGTTNGSTLVGNTLFPPSGILPIQGMSLMVAPLCFMYQDPAAVYRMHRTLYCRYWCRLCSFSSIGPPSPALPSLLRTYETLLQSLDPELVHHLEKLGIPPAAISTPWISRAFAGCLPVEEVLLLWDRVIGLDSLLPVALLAVAVMCFRRQVLMSCSASREVLDVMSDLSQLQTVPLLQAVLFHG